jgi:isocitrate dehydrogenase
LALYWAEKLAAQNKNSDLKNQFTEIFTQLSLLENEIITELNSIQGVEVNIGGYYHPIEKLANRAMRANEKFNIILDTI